MFYDVEYYYTDPDDTRLAQVNLPSKPTKDEAKSLVWSEVLPFDDLVVVSITESTNPPY